VPHIVTWFQFDAAGRGTGAQVSGDPRASEFLDTYRRCIGVFFASARRANPGATLEFVTNRLWDSEATQVAAEVDRLLDTLGVELAVVDYDHQPPSTFARRWWNQFYVLDVIDYLSRSRASDEPVLILDDDILFTTAHGSQSLSSEISTRGIATMPIGYPRSRRVNGASTEEIAMLLAGPAFDYSGGEFVGAMSSELPGLYLEAHATYDALMAAHGEDSALEFDEAHILSAAYSRLSATALTEPAAIRRIWTQPLKYRNVAANDLGRALWHVPAEKKYGLRRIYSDLVRDFDGFMSMDDSAWVKYAARKVGIPRNSGAKWTRDVSSALAQRAAKLAPHRRLSLRR